MARFIKSNPIEISENDLGAIMKLRQQIKELRRDIEALIAIADHRPVLGCEYDNENAPRYVELSTACIGAIVQVKEKEIAEIERTMNTTYGIIVKDAA